MAKTKSYRSLMITQQIDYLTEDKIIEALKHNSINEYAYILHNQDKDENGKEKAFHWHIVLRLNGSINEKYICDWFGIEPQYIERIKGRFVDALAYLVHKNEPLKHQYDLKDIKTNSNHIEKLIEEYKKVDFDEVIEKIGLGIIRRWNYSQFIDINTYIKNKNKIEAAFEYWEQQQELNPSRNLKVIFVTGEAGIGKSTYARYLAKQYGGGVCISSSSNDPLQDYKGQEVLLLDDLRDNVFTFTDLLKILDNHTNSSIKSRFRNKRFYGSLIIITSTIGLHNWYKNVKEENKFQLYRRINKQYHIENNSLFIGDTDENGDNSIKECYEFNLDDYKN